MTACGEWVKMNVVPESHGVAGGRGLCMGIKTAVIRALISTISEPEHGSSTAPCVFESIHMAAEFEGWIPL
jgi:hypothetical protein